MKLQNIKYYLLPFTSLFLLLETWNFFSRKRAKTQSSFLFTSIFFILFFFLGIWNFARAQAPGCPNITASPNMNINCNACTTLTSTVLQTGQTTNYIVGSIPYAPPAAFSGGTAVLVNIDDTWSSVINLPFNFCFYGNVYNKALIGANGLISFDLSMAGGWCEWSFSSSVPSAPPPPGGLYGNCIMGAFHDLDPSYGGTINYYIMGTAPCRMFVVNWNNIPHFDCNCSFFSTCKKTTQQIVIYETTNVIEVYIQSKQTCTSWNNGNSVIGIQNTAGSAGISPPGRNTGPWTASNEAWRFTPNGAPNWTVGWYNQANNAFVASGLTASVCPTGTTNYIAEVTYTNCDGATVVKKDTVTITMPGGFTTSFTQTEPSCSGCDGSVNITTTGGTSPFIFNIGSGNQLNGNFSGLCSGNYNVTVTDASGCSGVVPVSLIPPPPLTLSPSQSDIDCFGNTTGSCSVTVGGGTSPFTYLWSNTASTPSINNLSAGNYFVTVTDGAGCSSTQTFTIIEPSALSLIPSQTNVTCNSASDGAASVSVSGGTTNYSYLWSNSATTSSIQNIVSGNYSVTVTDASNCTLVQTFNITQTAPLIVTTSQTNVGCNGASTGAAGVSVSGGITPYSYLWNNNSTGSQISNLTSQIYTVTITDGNNCSETETFNITEPAVLTLSITPNDASCNNACNGTATANASGGTIPYSYGWSNGQGDSTITGLCIGTYSLILSDSNSCVTMGNITISEPIGFTISTDSINSNCGQNDGSATVTVSGATTPYNYLWDVGQTTATANNIAGGNHCVTITDNNGCDSIVCITVVDNPPPIADATSSDVLCGGDCNGTVSASAFLGNPPGVYFYLWNTGDTTAIVNSLCAGIYTVTVSDSKNCTSTASAIINEPTPVTINAYADTIICIGTSATLTANAGGGTAPYSYSWNNNITTSSQTVSPSSNICYTVSATDANGCSSPDSIQCVNLFPPMNAGSSVFPQKICSGDFIQLDATASGGNGQQYTYTWLDKNGNVISNLKQFQYKPTETFPDTAIYFVIASDQCSPDDTAFIEVNFYENPNADFQATDTTGCVPLPISFTNNSSPFSNIENSYWDFGDGFPVFPNNNLVIPHAYDSVGKYNVTLIVVSNDGNNCRDTLTKPAYIVVNPNPFADFSGSPQPTNVQNMLINFTDLSNGNNCELISWNWSFYDNDKTTLLGIDSVQNPQYNFSPISNTPDWWFLYFLEDTGDYPVKLIVTTEFGCRDTIEKNIHIDGIYYMKIANAFTPNDDGLNDYFFPTGVGILPEQNFTFYVFNRWGDVVFKSINLNSPWDGKDPKGKLVPQGVYVWRLDFEDVTHEQHKKITGHVTVLRNDQ